MAIHPQGWGQPAFSTPALLVSLHVHLLLSVPSLLSLPADVAMAASPAKPANSVLLALLSRHEVGICELGGLARVEDCLYAVAC